MKKRHLANTGKTNPKQSQTIPKQIEDPEGTQSKPTIYAQGKTLPSSGKTTTRSSTPGGRSIKAEPSHRISESTW